MEILFIQTGGTIDKDYPRKVASYAFEINQPAVENILKIVQPNFQYRIMKLLQKDSLDFTSADREAIYHACASSSSPYIVITHGTDTMIETARTLADITDKTIVLTGAMIPYKFLDSDAAFNVGVAIGGVTTLKPGVYVAMSGKVYPWNKCRKSPKTVKFVSA